ncbi:hypothetical protein GIB67_002262 [Kingdonia uniflora]|uniref:DOG1 domain-containing protein n=1 Tax=Kingdonia uniflora TaxID=39325 RepID=A0A7J7KWX3_9MAGN|nr:hypothetical protein GIB67_002262 [Kingdonia uniflora]
MADERAIERLKKQCLVIGRPFNLLLERDTEMKGALAFDAEYARWLEDHQRQINELHSAVNSHLGDNELRLLVDGVMTHYEEIFRLKSIGGKSDIFHMLSGMWLTPAERCFMWLGGFRSSELLKILGNHLEPLTDQQLLGICNLQQSSQQAEYVLYLIEPIDEVAIQNLQTYKEKKFVDISKEDLELGIYFFISYHMDLINMNLSRFALGVVELNGALYAVGGFDGNNYLEDFLLQWVSLGAWSFKTSVYNRSAEPAGESGRTCRSGERKKLVACYSNHLKTPLPIVVVDGDGLKVSVLGVPFNYVVSATAERRRLQREVLLFSGVEKEQFSILDCRSAVAPFRAQPLLFCGRYWVDCWRNWVFGGGDCLGFHQRLFGGLWVIRVVQRMSGVIVGFVAVCVADFGCGANFELDFGQESFVGIVIGFWALVVVGVVVFLFLSVTHSGSGSRFVEHITVGVLFGYLLPGLLLSNLILGRDSLFQEAGLKRSRTKGSEIPLIDRKMSAKNKRAAEVSIPLENSALSGYTTYSTATEAEALLTGVFGESKRKRVINSPLAPAQSSKRLLCQPLIERRKKDEGMGLETANVLGGQPLKSAVATEQRVTTGKKGPFDLLKSKAR